MRKLLTKTLVLAVLTALFLTVNALAVDIGTGVVRATSLRLRSEPNTNSDTLAYLPQDTQVAIQEKVEGWYKVVYNGITGYIHGGYVDFTPAPNEDGDGAAAEEPTLPEDQVEQVSINADELNLRSEPNAESTILKVLSRGTVVDLISTENGWCKVVYDGITGYVSEKYVTVVDEIAPQEPKTDRGIVTGNDVNLRGGPSTGHEVLTRVNAGLMVEVLEKLDGWWKIRIGDYTGYISADYIREYKEVEASALGAEIVVLAMKYLGTPYVYGGASPDGFDCSGFTTYIMKQFGISLSRTASGQWADNGVYVDRADLQPGDLVMFNDPSRNNGKACSHVGIYIGNNEFIHASSGSSGKYVKISSLSSNYYSTYYKGAKRVV